MAFDAEGAHAAPESAGALEDWSLVDAYDSVGADMKRVSDEFSRRFAEITPDTLEEGKRLLAEYEHRIDAMRRRVAALDRRSAVVWASLRSSLH